MIHSRIGEINTPGFPSEIAKKRIVGVRPLRSFELALQELTPAAFG